MLFDEAHSVCIIRILWLTMMEIYRPRVQICAEAQTPVESEFFMICLEAGATETKAL